MLIYTHSDVALHHSISIEHGSSCGGENASCHILSAAATVVQHHCFVNYGLVGGLCKYAHIYLQGKSKRSLLNKSLLPFYMIWPSSASVQTEKKEKILSHNLFLSSILLFIIHYLKHELPLWPVVTECSHSSHLRNKRIL